jgi:hypothetical protein
MHMPAVVPALILLLGAPPPAAGAGPALPGAEPLKGVVVQGRLLTARADAQGDVRIAVGPLRGDRTPAEPVSPPSSLPPRWHVGYGALWVAVAYDPAGRLGPESTESLLPYELRKVFNNRVHDWPDPPGDSPNARLGEPTPVTFARVCGRRAAFPYQLYYDYLPVGQFAALQLLLTDARGKVTPFAPEEPLAAYHVAITDEERRTPKWSFTVYRYEGKWDKAGQKWEERPWVKHESIAVGFREPFQALGQGDDYYFVTRSGKLFRAPKAPGGQPRKLEAVWDDPKRPVTAFLTDADAGRTFLFVPAKPAGGQPAFFELAPKPELVEYDPAAVPRPKAAEPRRTLLHYARILIALKKVKAE